MLIGINLISRNLCNVWGLVSITVGLFSIVLGLVSSVMDGYSGAMEAGVPGVPRNTQYLAAFFHKLSGKKKF